jgi:hypothetical protein
MILKIKEGLRMVEKNSEVLKQTLFALCKVSGRRTTDAFAYKVINTIISTLRSHYRVFEHVQIHGISNQDDIIVSKNIDEFDTSELYKAIETVIRIVHMDLEEDAGLYFIKEFKEQIGKETLFYIKNHGVDLGLLEMEQQHVFQYRQDKKKIAGDASLLGYTWKDVSKWKYDDLNNVCILYDVHEKVLDKLNLDAIIKEHITRLTGDEQIDDVLDLDTERFKKEFDLMVLLKQKDMDVDTALTLLHVSQEELEHMIDRLLNLGLLEYLDFDVVSLSEKGMKYIEQKK